MSINYKKLLKIKNIGNEFYCNCGNNSFIKIVNIEIKKPAKTYETIEGYICENCGHKIYQSEIKDFMKGE